MDKKVCIRPLHTSNVCDLFFGGIFSHSYLLKGVHFVTLAHRAKAFQSDA